MYIENNDKILYKPFFYDRDSLLIFQWNQSHLRLFWYQKVQKLP